MEIEALTITPEPPGRYRKAAEAWMPAGVYDGVARGEKRATALLRAFERHCKQRTHKTWQEFIFFRAEFEKGQE